MTHRRRDRRARTASPGAGGAATTRSTSTTTTASGARRCATSARCSSCSASRGSRRGSSWITILRKREAFREAFEGFDPEVVARLRRARRRAAARQPGHRAPPRQDHRHDRQRDGAGRHARCRHVARAGRVVARARRPDGAARATGPTSPPRRRSRPRSPSGLRKWGMRFVGPDHRLRLHAVGRPRRRPPRRLPPGRRRRRADAGAPRAADAARPQMRRATSAAAAQRGGQPAGAGGVADHVHLGVAAAGGAARRARRGPSVAAVGSGSSPIDDAGALGRGHQAEAPGQPELGRQHRRRRARARTSRPPLAGVHGERTRRPCCCPRRRPGPAAAASVEPAMARGRRRRGTRRRARARPTAHTSTSASAASADRRLEADRHAGVLGARRPASRAGPPRSGSAALGEGEPPAEPVARLAQLDAVAALGEPARALQAGRAAAGHDDAARRRRRRGRGSASWPASGFTAHCTGSFRKIAPMHRYW